jgi:hypothetical protein
MNPADLPLRDIHLPPPVPLWPPAPGWWGLLALLLLVLAVWSLLRYRERRRRALPAVARREMTALRQAYREHGDPRRLATDLSVLLRRICISRFPRTRVAALTGNAWLDFLDGQMGGDRFRNGIGQALATAPYGGGGDIDGEGLLSLCEEWLRAVLARSPRSEKRA